MNLKNRTILVTGGGSGIGLEIAKLFSEQGNQVIITGRNEEKLKLAASSLKNVTPLVCDINNEAQVSALVNRIEKDFPSLDILVNNAGKAFYYDLLDDHANGFEKSREEMMTNYFSAIRLNEQLIPLLNRQKDAAIVNVTSIVAFVPGAHLPTYAASKAAMHSYTQSLRVTLEQQGHIEVYELMPPLVNTEFSKEIGGHNGIHPSQVAKDLFDAMENGIREIHVGRTADLYKAFLASPQQALNIMNAGRETDNIETSSHVKS
jgi:uncharacterized oxidoreductase